LNSTATKVYGGNTTGTDTTIWQADIPYTNIIFGPATTNGTIYVYGLLGAASGSLKIYVRTLNATIVALGNDTSETSYIASDATLTTTVGSGTLISASFGLAVGPGYLGILTVNTDSSEDSQVYLTIVTGSTSATTKTLTANTASLTYQISSGVGSSIFYDSGSAAFFYTFLSSFGDAPFTIAISAGGYFASGNSSYFAASSYSISLGSSYGSTSAVTTPIIGGDNSTSASNIYVVYKDTSALITYFSKTVKATTTTALGSSTSLVADSSTSGNVTTYVPIGVWASNYTYGISLSLKAVGTSTTYTIANFYNASTTGALSGIELSGATGAAMAVYGFQVNTGYALVGQWPTATDYAYEYTYGLFLANASANGTSGTLSSSLYGPINIFEDANGAEWVGWTDVVLGSPTPEYTYAGYLAKLQGQVNPSTSFANALKGIMAIVAFCLAAVFTF
jgi:hypothetical protein